MDQLEWDGQTSLGDQLAMAVLCPTSESATPHQVLSSACSSQHRCLIRPEQLGHFLRVHRHAVIACHDAGGLHWSIADHLRHSADEVGLEALWGLSRGLRLADVGLLDQLVAMAEHGFERPYRSLKSLAVEFQAPMKLDDQQVRKHLDDQACQSWGEISDDLKEAAREISVAILKIYDGLIPEARRFAEENVSEDLVEEFGVLSLGLQVRAAIALAEAARIGFRLSKDADEAVARLVERSEMDYRRASRELGADPAARKCFRWDHNGCIERGPKGHIKFDKEKLQKWLTKTLDSSPGVNQIPFEPPRIGPNHISTTSNAWGEDLLDCHPLLRAWSELESAASVKRFVEARADPGRLCPIYETLPRINSRAPNLGQLRRFGESALFEAPPGMTLLVARLPDLELRCLAETYCSMYQGGTLARLFESETDVIHFIAEAIHRIWGDDAGGVIAFDALRDRDATTHRCYLELARALLRAAASGLEPGQVRRFLPAEFESHRDAFDIGKMYKTIAQRWLPELGRIHGGSPISILIEALGCHPGDLLWLTDEQHPDQTEHNIRELIAGRLKSPQLWNRIRDACVDPELGKRLALGHGSPELYEEWFTVTAVTGAGRVRGKVPFHREDFLDCRDLADDVRKVAACAIVESGCDLAGIAGDEFILHVLEKRSSDSPNIEADRVRERIEAATVGLLNLVPLGCQVVRREAW